ncbi:pentapeptide repeat-containing protein [filamentous cyanobacterium LEGE 11480]|uniref:Pentapeptide repeat-containing protein n=1 Tax=Romeriopsis navalis LEGE 11480 TaxID=2777977 RepID=A0A928Z5F0_9CYAN|nr:pentapeptide repeat-containing protein [Romeriopsis navalis]MBE9031398.1 pentapeptide repeat-containing protein [Romeriopsis navalis LEGE 11480]
MTMEPNQDLPPARLESPQPLLTTEIDQRGAEGLVRPTPVGPSASLFAYPWAQGRDVATPPLVVLGLIGSIVLITISFFLGGWFGTIMLLIGTIVALGLSLQVLAPQLKEYFANLLTGNAPLFLAGTALFAGLVGGLKLVGVDRPIAVWYAQANWNALGALGEVFGALGQIMIAVIAVYVAWRQYVISKDLTIQQNTITQQQTIDAYFQGVSELVIDDEGLLEDWPQERAIAEGRTAAILASVDALGRAKVLRFLSRARLLSPLKRDQRLGRPILDGQGGYAEDRLYGVRVIDLGIMLAGADLSKTDLRWSDLSDANLIRSNISDCELVKANLARTILVSATLRNSDINGARFFYGKVETASPRSRVEPPDYRTGAHTGAVVENTDFTNVEDLSEEQRQYICAWGGTKTRATVPGGCGDIPNKLGR